MPRNSNGERSVSEKAFSIYYSDTVVEGKLTLC